MGCHFLFQEIFLTHGLNPGLPHCRQTLYHLSHQRSQWLCGGSTVGLNGDLLPEGLCHTQVCCTQSPCPCGRPLLTHTSTGDTQTQFWLSLCGISGSWCTQGLFEPSEHLWWIRGLSLNEISPLLQICWGFSFALGHGVSFFFFFFFVGSSILQSMTVQQQAVVLEFSQEKMSTQPFTPPSYATWSGSN